MRDTLYFLIAVVCIFWSGLTVYLGLAGSGDENLALAAVFTALAVLLLILADYLIHTDRKDGKIPFVSIGLLIMVCTLTFPAHFHLYFEQWRGSDNLEALRLESDANLAEARLEGVRSILAQTQMDEDIAAARSELDGLLFQIEGAGGTVPRGLGERAHEHIFAIRQLGLFQSMVDMDDRTPPTLSYDRAIDWYDGYRQGVLRHIERLESGSSYCSALQKIRVEPLTSLGPTDTICLTALSANSAVSAIPAGTPPESVSSADVEHYLSAQNQELRNIETVVRSIDPSWTLAGKGIELAETTRARTGDVWSSLETARAHPEYRGAAITALVLSLFVDFAPLIAALAVIRPRDIGADENWRNDEKTRTNSIYEADTFGTVAVNPNEDSS